MTDRTITLRSDLGERLETLAGQQGRTLDDVFGKLLNSYAPIGSGHWVLTVAECMEAADTAEIDDPDASMNNRDHFEWHLHEQWEKTQSDGSDGQ